MDVVRPMPTPGNTEWFTADRFGLFIHFGLYAEAARHEWVKSREQISNEDYQKYFDHFDPDLYDPKAWAKAAKDAGMKAIQAKWYTNRLPQKRETLGDFRVAEEPLEVVDYI